MFGFINRLDEHGIIIYQGEPIASKRTFGGQEAILRWNGCDRFRDYKTKIYNKSIEFRVPITDINGIDVTSELKVFLYNAAKTKRIDDLLVRIWGGFLKEYNCIKVGTQILFRHKETYVGEVDDGIFHMKQFLFGFRRLEDIYDDKMNVIDGEHFDFYDGNKMGEDYDNLQYTYQGKKESTPLYGMYMPQMISEVFKEEEPLPNGKRLQGWQKKFMWDMGNINFLFHSRRAGKSFLLQLIQFLLVKAERPKKGFKKLRINYFCQTAETFNDMTEYMDGFAEAYGLPYVWKNSTATLQYVTYYQDGKGKPKQRVLGEVQFKSGLSKAKGLGGTPYAVIIDEASRQPEEIFKRARANVGLNQTLMFCLTTVNYEEERDRCYEEAMRAYFESMNYEPMEDTVVKIWKKYGLDKIKSPEEMATKQSTLEAARMEFLNTRKYSCAFYTIDDIEYIPQHIKEQTISEQAHEGEKFILAEYYSIFADGRKVFNAHAAIEDNIPERFEHIFLSFDQAEKHDNAALSIIGVVDFSMYVIDSIILAEQFDIQIQQIKRIKQEYSQYLMNGGKIRLSVDVTSKQSDVSSIEGKGLAIDCPIYWNNGNQQGYYDGRIMKVSRNALFSNAIECFNLMYVKISSKCDKKLGLLEELSKIVVKEGAYKTQKTTDKDDQVCALLMNLYYIYNILGLRKSLYEKDSMLETMDKVTDEDIIRMIRENRNQNRETNYSIINY